MSTADEIRRAQQEQKPVAMGTKRAPPEAPAQLQVLRLDTVERRPVVWLWLSRIPLGKITTLDSEPGMGKSLVTCDLAARVTTARPMPGGSPGRDGDVVLIALEDDAGDTIRPRIEDAEGDLSRVHFVEGVRVGQGERSLILPADLGVLEALVREVSAKLIIIDPVMAVVSAKIDSHSDQETRQALTPIKRLAERTGAAVLLVRHFTKAPGAKAAMRGGGSVAFVAAARSGLIIAPDPEDEEVRVLAVAKSNLAARAPSLSFRIVASPGGVAKIEWTGKSQLSADDLVAPATTRQSRMASAAEFLKKLLAKRPAFAADIEKAADFEGHGWRTVERAKDELEIVSHKQKDGRWLWSLPARPNGADRSAEPEQMVGIPYAPPGEDEEEHG